MGGEAADTKGRRRLSAPSGRASAAERRGLALAHPAKKDEPDRRVGAATRHQGFRKWGHHPQKGQGPPTARPFGTFRERVLRPVVRNVPLPPSP